LSITKKKKTRKSVADEQQITDPRKKKKKAKTKRFNQRERVRRGGGEQGAGKRSKRHQKQGFRKTQRGFEYPEGLSLRKKERDEVPRVP